MARSTARGLEKNVRIRVKRDGRRSRTGRIIAIHPHTRTLDYRDEYSGNVYMTAISKVSIIRPPRVPKTVEPVWSEA